MVSKENKADTDLYSDRVVVFLDILGFKEIVQKTVKDVEEQEKLLHILKYIEEQKNDDDSTVTLYANGKPTETLNIEGNQDRRVTTFSDSIVISYPNDQDGRNTLLWDVILLQCFLTKRGYLIRGGITYGKLYHKGNIVVGPAMVNAYELESKVAVYPRVLLSNDFYEKVKNNLNYPDLVRQDRDGFYCTNFGALYNDDDYETVLLDTEQKTSSFKSMPSIYAKFSWLLNYLKGIK